MPPTPSIFLFRCSAVHVSSKIPTRNYWNPMERNSHSTHNLTPDNPSTWRDVLICASLWKKNSASNYHTQRVGRSSRTIIMSQSRFSIVLLTKAENVARWHRGRRSSSANAVQVISFVSIFLFFFNTIPLHVICRRNQLAANIIASISTLIITLSLQPSQNPI